MNTHGLFITVEGIDGCGKTSQISVIKEFFERRGYSVVTTREPGGTELAEQLRKMILHGEMGSVTETMLAMAARRDHLENVIVPALKEEKVVISDRYLDSTYAYQGRGRGVEWAMISKLAAYACSIHTAGLENLYGNKPGCSIQGDQSSNVFIKPHITFWFDLPVDVAMQRFRADLTRTVTDNFEKQESEVYRRVSAGYNVLFQENLGRFVRIDASKTQSLVSGEIITWLAGSGQARFDFEEQPWQE